MGIGVTDFISLKDVRQRIDREYPNPGNHVEEDICVEHEAYNHTLLGNAFDYLTRFWLETKCREIYEPEPLIPSWALPESDSDLNSLILVDEEEYSALTRAARKKEMFVRTQMNAADAVDAALVLAGVDLDIGDSGSEIEANSFEDDVVSELQELFHLFREQDALLGDTVILGPDFGTRSYILEGHGDFIIDNTLIDVKTTEDPSFKPSYWRQLLAYYVLNDIHRELLDDPDAAEIPYPVLHEVGIYFARYGVVKTIDVNTVFDSDDEYKRFRAWFVDRAIEENHDGRVNYDETRELLTEPYDFDEQQTLFDY
jgi:hypothetical protein